MISFEVIIQTKTGNLFFGTFLQMEAVAHEWEGEVLSVTVIPEQYLTIPQHQFITEEISLAYRFPVHLIKFYYQPVGKVEVTR